MNRQSKITSMELFPPEVLTQVLKYLGFDELKEVRLVSRTWNDVICDVILKNRVITRVGTEDDHIKFAIPKFLKLLEGRSRDSSAATLVQNLGLDIVEYVDVNSMYLYSTLLDYLRDRKIDLRVKSIIFREHRGLLKLSYLRQILSHCRNSLTSLNVCLDWPQFIQLQEDLLWEPFPQLQDLHLELFMSYPVSVHENYELAIPAFRSCLDFPELKRLTLVVDDDKILLDTIGFGFPSIHLPKLRNIEVHSGVLTAQRLLRHVPKNDIIPLKRLEVAIAHAEEVSSLEAIVSSFSLTLKELVISTVFCWPRPRIRFPYLSHLTTFEMGVNTREISNWLRQTPNVKRIVIHSFDSDLEEIGDVPKQDLPVFPSVESVSMVIVDQMLLSLSGKRLDLGVQRFAISFPNVRTWEFRLFHGRETYISQSILGSLVVPAGTTSARVPVENLSYPFDGLKIPHQQSSLTAGLKRLRIVGRHPSVIERVLQMKVDELPSLQFFSFYMADIQARKSAKAADWTKFYGLHELEIQNLCSASPDFRGELMKCLPNLRCGCKKHRPLAPWYFF